MNVNMNYEPQEIEKADWIIIRLLSAMKQYIPEDVCFNNKDFRKSWGYLCKYDCLQLSNAFNSIKEENKT
jgi:hypothetical protein